MCRGFCADLSQVADGRNKVGVGFCSFATGKARERQVVEVEAEVVVRGVAIVHKEHGAGCAQVDERTAVVRADDVVALEFANRRAVFVGYGEDVVDYVGVGAFNLLDEDIFVFVVGVEDIRVEIFGHNYRRKEFAVFADVEAHVVVERQVFIKPADYGDYVAFGVAFALSHADYVFIRVVGGVAVDVRRNHFAVERCGNHLRKFACGHVNHFEHLFAAAQRLEECELLVKAFNRAELHPVADVVGDGLDFLAGLVVDVKSVDV